METAETTHPFRIRRPCDGFTYYDHELRKHIDGVCHPSHDRCQLVSFGSLDIELTLCGCAWNDQWGRRETIHEFIEEQYGPLCLSSKDRRRYSDDMVAYKTGSGGQHVHSWDLCRAAGCGKAATDPYRWTHDPNDEMRDDWRSRDSKYYEFINDCIYCSWECYAKTHVTPCPQCGELSLRVFNKKWTQLTENMFWKVDAVWLLRRDVYQMLKATVCSSQCARRHIESIKTTIRQHEELEKEIRCVKQVRKLTAMVKKSLRENNREALHSLQREFELAATLQE